MDKVILGINAWEGFFFLHTSLTQLLILLLLMLHLLECCNHIHYYLILFSAIEYQPWQIAVVDLGLSDMVNIGRYGRFFCHNLLLLRHKTALLRDFGYPPWTTRQRQH
jgi:hypothetical protein